MELNGVTELNMVKNSIQEGQPIQVFRRVNPPCKHFNEQNISKLCQYYNIILMLDAQPIRLWLYMTCMHGLYFMYKRSHEFKLNVRI